MTDEQTPAPLPSSDPPPLAPYVEQASTDTAPIPTPAPMPVAAPVMTPAAPAAPPPPIAWGAPPVAVAAAGGRTTLAAIAGAGLIVLGVLGGLLGIGIAVFGASVVKQIDLSSYGDFGNVNDPAALISGAVAFIGIIFVVYSLVYLIGGIGIVRSRGWGRVMGLIVGILSGIFWLLSLTSGGSGSGGNLFFPLVLFLIHAYVVVVLIMFWKKKTA